MQWQNQKEPMDYGSIDNETEKVEDMNTDNDRNLKRGNNIESTGKDIDKEQYHY